jgi:hypothetical protein
MCFQKNLILPLPVRNYKIETFQRFLSRSSVHDGARDEVDYGYDTTTRIDKIDVFLVEDDMSYI